MGKATRKLSAVRKEECFEPIQSKPLEPSSMKNEEEYEIEYETEKKEMYRIETSFLIHKRLMQFVEEGAYPLCEFLDVESIDDFVQWILFQ